MFDALGPVIVLNSAYFVLSDVNSIEMTQTLLQEFFTKLLEVKIVFTLPE